MKDTISQAATLATTYSVAHNPGFPLTFGYRPITTSTRYLDSMGDSTPPGSNIYRDKTHATSDSYVLRDDLNAKRIFDLFSGAPGCHTDFSGLVMIAWFQNSPEDWYKLFRTKNARLPYHVILELITGVRRQETSKFVNCSLDMFPNISPTPSFDMLQDLSIDNHVNVLRSLQEF